MMNTPPPLVSVVMPAYNHGKYVVEAMRSVREQTFTQWELIVINDGSTDDTWAQIEAAVAEWNDPRIQIHTQSNAGSHATINAGLALAVAPYLAILNSDDRYAPGRLQRLMAEAQTHADGVFLVTGLRLIDEHGEVAPSSHWWNTMYGELQQRWRDALADSDHPAVDALLWGNFTVSTSNFFMSREIWHRTGVFKHLRYVPDWDYALRVVAHRPQALRFLVDEPLLDYRLHGQNTILHGALRNHAEAYRVLRMFQRAWARQGRALPVHAVDRLHYLARFIRHEHARGQLEKQQVGWVALVQSKDDQIQALHRQVETALATQQDMLASRSWRWMAPLRRLGGMARALGRVPRRWARRAKNLVIRGHLPAGPDPYGQWLAQEATQLARLQAQRVDLLAALASRPLVSVAMPVHNTPPVFLQAAVASVQAQWYPDWELCICNDGSTRADTLATLQSLADADPRIRVVHRSQSGHIVHASNDAIQLARGEFVVFLDHDDQLAPQALLRLMQVQATQPDADLIYSDEDKLNEQGQRCLPLFKPDWSPALQWSQNYVGHAMCVRRQRLLQVGGFAEGSQGSQDHDLVLRLALAGARFVHVPEVLYHWRMHSASTASGAGAKPYAHDAGKAAVRRHLMERYGDRLDRVDDGDYTFVYSPRFVVPVDTLVSIVIPTRDRADLLQDCIDSIHRVTVGTWYEIVVLDNGSTEAATHRYFQALAADARVRVVPADMPFNWSRLNNLGRQQARGQVLVFLNNDTVVISPDWLQRLSEYALLPDVATVGPLLLYPDNTIQHAGVVVGMGGWADHVFKGQALQHYPTPFVSSMLPRNVLANTGACVAIATHRLDALGGFDEAFEICGSDVELGIRAHKQGYQNIYLPAARLYHLESKTRTPHVPAVDFEQSALKYAPYRLHGDPFFNPNLNLACATPSPRFPNV